MKLNLAVKRIVATKLIPPAQYFDKR